MDDATVPTSGTSSHEDEEQTADHEQEQASSQPAMRDLEDDSGVEEDSSKDDGESVDDIPPTADERLAQEKRFDQILNTVLILLIVSVVGVGAWFGVTVYQVRWQERMSTPAGRAIVELENQIRANPNDVVLRVRLGEAYATAGMYSEALDSFDQGLKLDPEHSGAYLDIGLVFMAQGEWAEAEKAFQKTLDITEGMDYEELSSRRDQAYFYLGQIAVEDGRFEDAIGYLKAALRIRRDASDTYFQLARAYHGLDEIDAAIENLRIAVTFDPNYAEARFLLGKIYLEDGRDAYAATEFRKAADLVPESDLPVEALASLGVAEERFENAQIALEEGARDEAIDQVTIAVAIDPDLVEGLLLRGQLLESDPERVEEALSSFERVLTLEPENEEAKAGVERLSTDEAATDVTAE